MSNFETEMWNLKFEQRSNSRWNKHDDPSERQIYNNNVLFFDFWNICSMWSLNNNDAIQDFDENDSKRDQEVC
jgi:hypothetical protein